VDQLLTCQVTRTSDPLESLNWTRGWFTWNLVPLNRVSKPLVLFDTPGDQVTLFGSVQRNRGSMGATRKMSRRLASVRMNNGRNYCMGSQIRLTACEARL